jgi:ketosteroid isomerase-like protein
LILPFLTPNDVALSGSLIQEAAGVFSIGVAKGLSEPEDSMDAAAVERWVEGYIRAWRSNDRDDIGGLFTDDAAYFTAPHREPWRGRRGIVDGWLDRKDEPGDWAFRYEIVAICDDLAFVQGRTDYEGQDPPAYANLWVIRLTEEGRCSEFTEWWMEVRD